MDDMLDLIESVSEGFPTYSYLNNAYHLTDFALQLDVVPNLTFF